MNDWPHQTFADHELTRLLAEGHRKICLTSPTGGGKARMICQRIEKAIQEGKKAVLYTNRRLLIDQLIRVLKAHGIEFGVRAAGHHDDRHLPVQISSLPTENHRVLKSEQWDVHGADGNVLAIVDELHINKSSVAEKIIGKHLEAGGAFIGVTATPIDIGHLCDTLLVAGTQSELRRCGALVPAYHYGPDEPDMVRFKPNVKTGEYSENDVRKAIMTKCIFARVLEHYRLLNGEGRPTILFAPGVKESIWFAQQFSENGIKAAHIDGNGIWVDGEYQRTKDREQILSDIRSGFIKVLTNRFVLREGIDIPEVSHLILATVMNGLQTYLQSAGRGLRKCANKDRLTIQDHGGHFWRHGSVNMDRQWNLGYTENMIGGMRQEFLRENPSREPIRCPNCNLVRASGVVCPQCGHESTKKSRIVVQTDGRLKEHVGDIYKPRLVKMKPDTADVWTKTYHRAKNSKNRMTFRQAEGLFVYENFYYPPRDLPLMPTNPTDWFRSVCDVPRENLTR